jgi:hypothetical protein
MDNADPFISELREHCANDPDVLGLVLCGSSAEAGRRDQWSDHDFLVITADGTPEHYRTELRWLPDHEQIAFSCRETAHGLKALYRTGLMIEFAVFDRAEFAGCALNHYEVALDRGGVIEAAASIRDRSMTPRNVDRLDEFRLFLDLVYLGVGRARRGERLSANVMIRTYATEHLLRLARDLLPVERTIDLDALDIWRRLEGADQALAEAVDEALARPVERAARVLLDVAEEYLPGRWPEYPPADVGVVRTLLGW